MKALFTLNSAESKRLIAKAVVTLPQVQSALNKGMIIIGAGTTNAFVLEELTGTVVDKARYTAGIIAGGRQCVTSTDERLDPVVLVDGVRSDLSWEEAVAKIGAGDVFIKGGNAIDPDGVVGIQMAHPEGGTIGKALPVVVARGAQLILPVGLEKFIPDVALAADVSGIHSFDLSIGIKVGLMPVTYGQPITELEALEKLAQVEAYCISAGGIDGSEGSVTLVVEGPSKEVEVLFGLVKSIKGEQPISALRQKCSECGSKCSYPGK
ncbi:MAG: hypothetical protein FWE48_03360 [Coriobacteriia bacterium]|nr:hypothetical protein [Coriobacteriia bacterium]MCL2746114.1 hypothetical protein [Coriobacteriia bacterium]MCL2870275.1 hypothetical protein [Coriobacteriia bacterium]